MVLSVYDWNTSLEPKAIPLLYARFPDSLRNAGRISCSKSHNIWTDSVIPLISCHSSKDPRSESFRELQPVIEVRANESLICLAFPSPCFLESLRNESYNDSYSVLGHKNRPNCADSFHQLSRFPSYPSDELRTSVGNCRRIGEDGEADALQHRCVARVYVTIWFADISLMQNWMTILTQDWLLWSSGCDGIWAERDGKLK